MAGLWCVKHKIAVHNVALAFRNALEFADMLEPSFQPADILEGISGRQNTQAELLMIADAVDLYYAGKIEQARGAHSKYCLLFLAQTTYSCNAWETEQHFDAASVEPCTAAMYHCYPTPCLTVTPAAITCYLLQPETNSISL